MNYIELILLGIIQGITEFLPISSSGHLLIGRSIFGIQSTGTGSFIEVFLHGGTLLSILLYWKNDLIDSVKKTITGKSNLFLNIVIATIPAGIIGLLFKKNIDNYFFNIENIYYLPIAYLFLAIILCLTKYKFKNYNMYNEMFYTFALLIGIAQCFAIIPGVSRSGMTIAIALFLGINQKTATNFSFMLAIPILTFSFIDSLFENFTLLSDITLFWPLMIGFISSFLTGYFAIGLLVKMIEKNRLWYFSIYCLFLSFILGYYHGG